MPVHRVIDVTTAGPAIQRELAMVKVRGPGESPAALRLADAFRARVIDATTESFVFEITGASDKIESFINLMLPVGLVEIVPHRHRRHRPRPGRDRWTTGRLADLRVSGWPRCGLKVARGTKCVWRT